MFERVECPLCKRQAALSIELIGKDGHYTGRCEFCGVVSGALELRVEEPVLKASYHSRMSGFLRSLPQDARATDLVEALLRSYPPERQLAGITVQDLLHDHQDQITDASSVIAAMDLLADEGNIRLGRSNSRTDVFASIRAYVLKRKSPTPVGGVRL
jgi:hypothetical protein